MAGSERLRGLDAMRALVVVGLIFFHSALIFDTRDDYYVRNGETADLSALAALGVVWAMPLLFLTAGLGVWHSLNRRTAILALLTRPRADRSPAGSTRPSSALAGRAAEAVLPVYVLHQPVLVAIAFYGVRWNLHPLAEYLLISMGTLLAVLAAYHLLIRRIQPTRVLLGLRPTPAAPDPSAGRPAGPLNPR